MILVNDISSLHSFSLQGRHVKTGQLAAIKVMDVTGVRAQAVQAMTVSVSMSVRLLHFHTCLCAWCHSNTHKYEWVIHFKWHLYLFMLFEM